MKKIISIVLGVLIVGGGIFFAVTNFAEKKVSDGKVSNPVLVTNSKRKIIAIGDSLTAGYGVLMSESYPKILEEKLKEKYPDVAVVNAGISGETTAGLLERIDFILSQNPEMVLVTIGGNDAFRSVPINTTKQNIDKIVKKLKTKVLPEKIFLMQIRSPKNLRESYEKSFNGMYKEISSKYSVKLVPFVVEEVFLDKTKMQEDGIHPNKEGYELLVDKYIYKEVVRVLEN